MIEGEDGEKGKEGEKGKRTLSHLEIKERLQISKELRTMRKWFRTKFRINCSKKIENK